MGGVGWGAQEGDCDEKAVTAKETNKESGSWSDRSESWGEDIRDLVQLRVTLTGTPTQFNSIRLTTVYPAYFIFIL